MTPQLCSSQLCSSRPLVLAAFLTLGCSNAEYLDEGTVVLKESNDGTLLVEVFADTCYSKSNSELEAAECSVNVEDETLTVRSRIVVEEQTTLYTTFECKLYSAKCAVGELLPEGRYTVRLGEEKRTVTVPLESECVALGDGPATTFCGD